MFRSIYFHDPNGYRLEFTSAEDREAQVFEDHAAKARDLLAEWSDWKANRHSAAAE